LTLALRTRILPTRPRRTDRQPPPGRHGQPTEVVVTLRRAREREERQEIPVEVRDEPVLVQVWGLGEEVQNRGGDGLIVDHGVTVERQRPALLPAPERVKRI